jgi:hypothetical protein
MRTLACVFLAATLGGCIAGLDDGDESAATSSDTDELAAVTYHCPVTGEDPEGSDVWLELESTSGKAILSRDKSFSTKERFTGVLDPTYKPTERVNDVRYLGFDGWVADGTTKLYVLKALQTQGGQGDIFVDTVTSKFTEVVYACDGP